MVEFDGALPPMQFYSFLEAGGVLAASIICGQYSTRGSGSGLLGKTGRGRLVKVGVRPGHARGKASCDISEHGTPARGEVRCDSGRTAGRLYELSRPRALVA
jgi:hypothetical protein